MPPPDPHCGPLRTPAFVPIRRSMAMSSATTPSRHHPPRPPHAPRVGPYGSALFAAASACPSPLRVIPGRSSSSFSSSSSLAPAGEFFTPRPRPSDGPLYGLIRKPPSNIDPPSRHRCYHRPTRATPRRSSWSPATFPALPSLPQTALLPSPCFLTASQAAAMLRTTLRPRPPSHAPQKAHCALYAPPFVALTQGPEGFASPRAPLTQGLSSHHDSSSYCSLDLSPSRSALRSLHLKA